MKQGTLKSAAAAVEKIIADRREAEQLGDFQPFPEDLTRRLAWKQWAETLTGEQLCITFDAVVSLFTLQGPEHFHPIMSEIRRRVSTTKPRDGTGRAMKAFLKAFREPKKTS